MPRNKKGLLLISLLIAVGLWMYVMGNIDPSTTGIKVEMRGTDFLESQNLTPTLNGPNMVTITIEGKRSQINKAKRKGIQAYVDVTNCEYGKNEGKIQIQMPDGVTEVSVEAISREMARFTVK